MTTSQPADDGSVRPWTIRRFGADPHEVCTHCGGSGFAPRAVAPRPEPVAPRLTVALPVVSATDRATVERIFVVLGEVLDGRRPEAQLKGTAPVLRYVRAARSTRARTAGATRVLSLRTTCPARDAIEAAAVVQLNGRPRAVAGRLQNADGRWVLTEVRIL